MPAKYDQLTSTAKEGVKGLAKSAASGSKEYKEAEAALQTAYEKAVKLLKNNFGIAMTTQKPNPAKLLPEMQKANKPVEFLVGTEGDKVTLVAQVGNTKNTLGLFDMSKERDLKVARVRLESLISAGLADKKELAEFDAAHVDKGALEERKKRLSVHLKKLEEQHKDLKGKLAAKEKLKGDYSKVTVEQAMKLAPVWADVFDFAKKEHNDENFTFLKEIEKGSDPKPILDKIEDINLSAAVKKNLLASAAAGKPDFKPAFMEVSKMVQADTMVRYRAAKAGAIDVELKAIEKKIDEVEKSGKEAKVELAGIDKKLKG